MSLNAHNRERRALQIVVAALAVVPIGAGLAGAFAGLSLFVHGPFALDSHYRYLSGILFAVGVLYLRLVPHIEQGGVQMRLLTTLVFVGGLIRLLALAPAFRMDPVVVFALAMELLVAPLLLAWQARVARNADESIRD